MCGRYYIEPDEDDLRFRAALDEINRRALTRPVKTAGEIFPSDTVPALAPGKDLSPSAFAMKWGYTLPDGRLIINARSESADEKPLFRDGMRHRRCVLPASRYFEWRRDGKTAVKYRISNRDGGCLYLAGLYRIEEGIPVFAILTRAASDAVSFIHDRMPVILPGALADQWLDPLADPRLIMADALGDMRAEEA